MSSEGDEAGRSPVQDPDRLERLWSLHVLDTPAEAAFDNLSTLVGRLLDVPVALVSFVDRDRQFFKSCWGTIPEPWMSERQTPLTHSFCRHVVERAEPLVVQDAREHPLVCNNPAVEDLGVVAYAGMPITTPDGLILGSLCAVDIRPRRWTEEELSSLSLVTESLNTEIALRSRLRDEIALRDDLEAAKEAAEHANAAKDRLLAHVSHQLRTPLSGVLGFAELLDDDRLDDEQRSFLDIVSKSATSLLQLVDGLLRYVELESAARSAVRSAFEPRGLVAEVERLLEAGAAEHAGLEFRVGLADEMPRAVLGDVERIRAVVAELVSNALRFTDEGRIEVDVELVEAGEGEATLSVRVRDTGIGIQAARLSEIFSALSAHDGSGGHSRGGLGMGLAIARLHAEAMGGEIGVDSTVGEGSAFILSVPVGLS